MAPNPTLTNGRSGLLKGRNTTAYHRIAEDSKAEECVFVLVISGMPTKKKVK